MCHSRTIAMLVRTAHAHRRWQHKLLTRSPFANSCRHKRGAARVDARGHRPMFEARRQYRARTIPIAHERTTSRRRRVVTRWHRRVARRCGLAATHRSATPLDAQDATRVVAAIGLVPRATPCDAGVTRVKKREVCAFGATVVCGKTTAESTESSERRRLCALYVFCGCFTLDVEFSAAAAWLSRVYITARSQ